MLFNSMAFAIFLPIVFLLYWICPGRYRYLFMIAASYYFYASMDVKYAFLLLFMTLLSFGLALLVEKASSPQSKKWILMSGVVLLLTGLIIFKLPFEPATIKLMLPVGISFYTFQTLGYLIDIYRGKYPAERHFGYYCLFVSFFPQLLSGPIGRADALLPQLKRIPVFDSTQSAYGLKLMAVGYFKKLVVANLLVSTVDSVYDNPHSYIGLVYIIVTILFAIQIYCDFSGYTDIAIGCAKLFGIELTENFKSPYFSHSIKEFWSRWHISLSSWFRDYVYIPLGGNRVGKWRHMLNLMLTFLVSGLWHGAGITYLVWGGLHGLYQIVETFLYKSNGCHALRSNRMSNKKHPGQGTASRLFSQLLTFSAVCFAWVFFRAGSLSDAWRMISLNFYNIGNPTDYLKTAVICLDMTYEHMLYISVPILLLALYDYASLKTDVIAYISAKKAWIRYPVYILFLLVILLFSEKGVSTEFYYFQF